jgi:hypothetical protein
MVPNADSSPLWSLSDQIAQPSAAAQMREPPEATVAEEIAVERVIGPVEAEMAAERVETQSSPPETPAPAPETPALAQPSADARKGWWQRRFKM